MTRKERYARAAHAMQSGVKFAQETLSDCDSPKHLRVGVNAAMCSHAALVYLLMKRGIITEREYEEAVATEMELSKMGRKVTLG